MTEKEDKRLCFQWKKQHDTILLREILALEPYNCKQGTKERGGAWTNIADQLNSLQGYFFKVSQRSVRERFDKLLKEFKLKEKVEKNASGVDCDYDEIHQLLTDISERIEETEEGFKNVKEKVEREKLQAEEMRKQATERLGETKKRLAEGKDITTKKKRNGQSEADMILLMQDSLELKKEEQRNQLELRMKELQVQQQTQQQQQQFVQQFLLQQQQFQQNQQAVNATMLKALCDLTKKNNTR